MHPCSSIIHAHRCSVALDGSNWMDRTRHSSDNAPYADYALHGVTVPFPYEKSYTCARREERWIVTMQVRPWMHLACLEKIYGLQALARAIDRCGWSRAYGAMCVGPRHYCRNRNPTPSSLGTRPTLSLPSLFFYLPLPLPLCPPVHLAIDVLACLLLARDLNAPSPPPTNHTNQPSKDGFGCAVRAPVLRALHLLQHRARGKLLEKLDPKNHVCVGLGRSRVMQYS